MQDPDRMDGDPRQSGDAGWDTGGESAGDSGGQPRPPRTPRAPRAPQRHWIARGVPIVHEDQDLVIVDKPAGLLTANMPGETREALFDLIKEYARRRSRKAKPWIIHRLDKEASGLLVFAKNERAFNWLKEDFRAKRVHRIYLAVVEGEIGADTDKAAEQASSAGSQEAGPSSARTAATRQLPSGTVQSFLREDERGPVTSVNLGDVAKESARYTTRPWRGERPPPSRGFRERRSKYQPEEPDPQAPRLAVTHWRVLARGNGRTLVQLRLETGRKNQIRVHMRELGHPIVGDRRYGAATDPLGRVCLHASELGLTHPSSGQTARFNSPAPASFYRLVGEKPPPASEARADVDDALAERTARAPAAPTSWEAVAEWYDTMIAEEKSDHFRDVIVPGTLRLLQPRPGMRVLDLACGQGALARRLAEQGLEILGVDASPTLIDAARARSEGLANLRFSVADARDAAAVQSAAGEQPLDAITCIMALMNIDPLEGVFRGAAQVLKPGGAFIGVILHPAFRSPGQTAWGWDQPRPEGRSGFRGRDSRAQPRPRPGEDRPPGRQYRRVEGYLSPGHSPITMNPGYVAHGAEPVTTWTFHRPLQSYFKALAEAGFLVETLEEWPSLRQSQPGPRAPEENRVRREIPMFLGWRALKRPVE